MCSAVATYMHTYLVLVEVHEQANSTKCSNSSIARNHIYCSLFFGSIHHTYIFKHV
jgi:hypothetical protein